MRRALTVFALALLAPALARAAPVTLAWDPNPPAEQVTRYQVLEGTRVLWEGAKTEATVDLAPGVHTLTAKACNTWGCSDPSAPVSTPGLATTPKGLRITITITVQ